MRLAIALLLTGAAAFAGAVGWTDAGDEPVLEDETVQAEPAAVDLEAAAQDSMDVWLAPYRDFPAPAGVSDLEAEAWVDATLAGMSLEERVAQLFVVELGAVRDPDGLARMGIGGFHISRRTAPMEVLSVTTRLSSRTDVPLFFTADYEWGVGTRSSNFTELPAAMAYGAADSEALAETGGAVTALEARAQGINVLFAPVADVNNNPANPIINTRSFGEDPERVGELAGAYVRGAQRNGVLATLKHFPGHGNTDTDTHVAFAAVPG
ncbi:glycoside hydrolase family 3 N-terminal domain-containing protein, partial [Rubrivirga sp.]|uniref:glycoside hydrolase family 3 N-terminal domain-containing protein n=1 Tax=Rubrivirga sp. TaxID=1885344 RepID=UPI003C73FB94